MKVKITKKHRYLTLTIMMTLFLYYFALDPSERGLAFFLIAAAISLAGSFIVHLPNSKILNTLVTNVISISLVMGIMLSLFYFPNLSTTFRLLSLGVFAALYYLILSMNNIFLVVEDRGEPIPLYRVAITWNKILMASVAIPFLAGLYKISFLSIYEIAISVAVALLFFVFLIWTLKFSPDVKKYKVGEILTLLAFAGFMVGCSSLAVSFIPTESFLRALFVSSILIFGVSYIEAHLKNTLNNKLIREHLAISLLFLILVLVFNP